MAKYTKAEIAESRESLRRLFLDHNIREVKCCLKHVSKSGMARDIKLYVVMPARGDYPGDLRSITYDAAVVLGESVRNEGVRMTGCGMDMGFHAVYNLAWALFGRPDTWSAEDVEKLAPSLHKGNETDPGYILHHHWI